jgi:hypothetical protein
MVEKNCKLLYKEGRKKVPYPTNLAQNVGTRKGTVTYKRMSLPRNGPVSKKPCKGFKPMLRKQTQKHLTKILRGACTELARGVEHCSVLWTDLETSSRSMLTCSSSSPSLPRIEHRSVNANVATVPGSIPASSSIVQLKVVSFLSWWICISYFYHLWTEEQKI